MIPLIFILSFFWTANGECQPLEKFAIAQAAYDGVKMADDFIGLSTTYFYSIKNKQQSGAVYNQDIEHQINSINKKIKSLTRQASKSADVVSNTLFQLNEAINQLIVDSSTNSSPAVIAEDYKQIQEVVNAFKGSFINTIKNRDEPVFKAINLAQSALQRSALNIETYIDQLNVLLFKSSSANIKLLNSDIHLGASLSKFVEASAIAAYLGNRKE